MSLYGEKRSRERKRKNDAYGAAAHVEDKFLERSTGLLATSGLISLELSEDTDHGEKEGGRRGSESRVECV